MLAQAQPSLLDMIPGARSAIDYLISKVADFQRVPSRLAALQTNFVNVKRVAESKGKLGYATEAALAIQSVMNMQTQHQKASVSVGNALDQLRSSGLLAGTVDVAIAVADASAKVATLLNGTSGLEKQLDSLRGKVMSQEEQSATASGSAKVSVAKYLLYGGGIYLALKALKRGRGTLKW